mgnify:FL=1
MEQLAVMNLNNKVAPLAGAWIETSLRSRIICQLPVAPLAGAWIETPAAGSLSPTPDIVAPLAGAWIETPRDGTIHISLGSRTPRGCVD